MRSRFTSQPHLEYRPTGYHWRRRWPRRWLAPGVRTPSKKSSLLLPLRTHVLPDAKVLARKLTLLSDIAFARRTETTMAIGPDKMAEYLEELGCFLVEVRDLAREVAPQLMPDAALYEAACAEAAIDTLRHALAMRDREPARQPLREVAARLGLTIDEADADWPRLAFRALRVMLDAAQENARRDQGVYDLPSPHFRSARSQQPSILPDRVQTTVVRAISPFPLRAVARPDEPIIPQPAPQQPLPLAFDAAITGQNNSKADATASDKAIEPDPKARIARSSSGTASMLLGDYFDLYIAKKLEGYTDDFGEEEVPDEESGRRWKKSSLNNMQVAKRLWLGLLGNRPFLDIPSEDIREAKAKLRRLPETHSKSCTETRDLDALIAATQRKRATSSRQWPRPGVPAAPRPRSSGRGSTT